MSSSQLDLVAGFARLDVLVVGEAFLDGWLAGPSRRLSREAPVPIVDVTQTAYCPGAAANAAAGVAALGARLRFLSVVGDDADGGQLRRALAAAAIPDDDVLVEPNRRTVAKRRVLAGGQMLVRYDEGDTDDVADRTRQLLLDRLDRLFPLADAVLVCDYAAGLFPEPVRRRLAELQAATPRLLVVDAREPGRWADLGATAMTPNWPEALSLLPRVDDGRSRAEWASQLADPLLDAAGARVLAVTLDTDGAVVLERGRPAYRLYTSAVPHAQTAGAGDSFAAAFTLALAAGADSAAAGELGAAAASVVVRRPATSVCTAAELRDAVASRQHALLDRRELAECVRAHRALGRRIVFTNGCFDVLHRGHVAYLNEAKAQGDVLVVGLNSDASVGRLKGPGRPVNGAEDRAAVLAGLSCVDHLVVFDGDTAAEVLELVRPDVYVKGGDYTPEMLPEAPLVERLGGTVRILGYVEDRSTTGLLDRIRSAR